MYNFIVSQLPSKPFNWIFQLLHVFNVLFSQEDVEKKAKVEEKKEENADKEKGNDRSDNENLFSWFSYSCAELLPDAYYIEWRSSLKLKSSVFVYRVKIIIEVVQV